ncbi:methyltransferase [Reichenbachiella sp.]|uniref:methyltransferase n=1 Tax=Reichenbachiella sp. TaxID=2184521 RepID=UPI003BAF9F79
MNHYDHIAWIYDSLAKWVFRGNVLKSQCHFLSHLNANERIIIIGGGSGEILKSIDQLNIPLTVDFIEPSMQMIEKARKWTPESSNLSVNFHQRKFESFKSLKEYDWICCFFFLDLFEKKSLQIHIDRIKKLMNVQSKLLVSDFEIGKDSGWKRVLSLIMHKFFKVTTRLESNGLKDINGAVINSGFHKTEEAHFFSRFIFSAIYQKEVL